MPSLSQIYNQGGGSSVSSVPIGSYVDLPTDAPNLYTVGTQKFLRSGVTALASAYPNVPASLTGQLFNTATAAPATLAGQNSATKAHFLMAGDGVTTMVAMPRGAQYFYMQSSDSGVTWTKRVMPWSQEVVGLVYLNSKFILVYKSGRIFTSTDGSTWTFVGLRNYQSKVARVKVANGRLFLLPYSNTSYSLNASQAQLYLWWTADGTTWQQTNMGSTAMWCDVAHNGTTYVAISCEASGTQVVWRVNAAGDPPTSGWTASTTQFNTAGNGAQAGMGPCCRIVNLDTTFIMLHERGSYVSYYTYYAAWASRSTDGATWTMASVIAATSSPDFNIPQAYIFGTTCYVSYFANTNPGGGNNRSVGYWTQIGSGWTAYSLSGPNLQTVANPIGGWWGDDIVLMAGKYWSVGYATQYSAGGPYNTPYEKECAFYTTNVQNAFTIVQWWGPYSINGQLFSDNANKLAIMPAIQDRYGGVNGVPTVWGGTASYNATSGAISNSYLYTDDGGVTWNTRKLPIVANWTGWGKANGFFFGAPGVSSPSDQAGATQWKTDWNLDQKVYRSADLLTWTQPGSLPANFTAYHFSQCAGRVIAIGFSSALNRFASSHSDDNGATWNTPYAIDNTANVTTASVTGAVAEPFYEPNLKRLYVVGGSTSTTNTRYVYMTDNGFTWTRLTCHVFAEDYVSQIVVLPSGTILLFSQQSGNYYYTVDDGINWTVVRLDPTSSNTNRVRATVDPVSGWIFAIGADAIYVSKNNGGSFSRNNINASTAPLQINAYNKKVSFIDQYYARTVLSDTYILNQYSISPNTGMTKYLRVE